VRRGGVVSFVLVAGPLLGSLLVILTTTSLAVLNVIAGVVYAVLLPFAALRTAYVYLDVRVRLELERTSEREPDVLDAESEPAF
jgi:hypothetical protein